MHDHWRRRASRRGRVADGHAVARCHRHCRRRPAARVGARCSPGRCLERSPDRRPARHAIELRVDEGHRQRPRVGGLHRDRRRSPTRSAIAAGASRFLAIESCGQCTPCKHGRRRDRRTACEGRGRERDRRRPRRDHGLAWKRWPTERVAALPRNSKQSSAASSTRSSQQVAARFEAGAEPVPVHLVVPLVDIADKGEVVDADLRRRSSRTGPSTMSTAARRRSIASPTIDPVRPWRASDRISQRADAHPEPSCGVGAARIPRLPKLSPLMPRRSPQR